ncbi:MAG: hypothetical protein QXF25_03005 [Candidatus Pacearchaeota archaeon]
MIFEAAVIKIQSKLLKFKYPKLLGLVVAVILAYYIFSQAFVREFFAGLNSWGYLGAFISGLFFSFGFTGPFAAGAFITLEIKNIFLAAVLGGFGAMISDMLIFSFIRFSFMDEFKRLQKTKAIKEMSRMIDYGLGHKIKIYLMYAFAGFLIASPLPDEAGVIILAGLTKIKPSRLAIIGWICNTLGILVLLMI